MRFLRQAVLLLLLAMLCGGPVTALWAQAPCRSATAMCPMCLHAAKLMDAPERMHCMGVAALHARLPIALPAPVTVCTCPPQQTRVAEALTVSPSGHLAPPALIPLQSVWPPAARPAPEASVSDAPRGRLRPDAPLPLRV